MRRRPRGYALLLVLLVTTAVAGTGAIVGTRIAAQLKAAPADDARAQLLWLARSAAARGRPGGGSLTVDGERVRLDVALSGTRVVAKAEGRAGRAVVTRDGERYEERFRRAR